MWISSWLLLIVLTLAPAQAGPEALPHGVDTFEVVAASEGRPATISLDVVDADIHSLLRLFGEVGGLNFVVDDSVKGTVTARLTDVSWQDALAAILLTKGLMAVPVAGGAPVLRVEPFPSR